LFLSISPLGKLYIWYRRELVSGAAPFSLYLPNISNCVQRCALQRCVRIIQPPRTGIGEAVWTGVVVLAVALASGDKSSQGQCLARLFRYLNVLLAVKVEVVSRNAYSGGLKRYFDISRVRHVLL
jgi:hypothetical protein